MNGKTNAFNWQGSIGAGNSDGSVGIKKYSSATLWTGYKWDIIDLGKVYTDPLYDNRHINSAYTISVDSKVG